jgi:D-glycero-alpha-D-manno-heptose-7-phosphate kinase
VRGIRVTTRCRVDLAGGTLDIWPLGLLHPGATTVNVAVELPVRVALAPREAGYSVRQGTERREVDHPRRLASDPRTSLVALVLEAERVAPCDLTLSSASPPGAGLGASSALTVALLAAAELAREGTLTRTVDERSAAARDLEARLMSLPTGRQDHFPAQLGGVLALEHLPGGERVGRLGVDLDGLGERLLVAYTGQSHFSAGQNWQVVRGRLDGDPQVAARFDAIRDVALEMVAALKTADWPLVGNLLAAEWRARRELAEGISTPGIEALLDLAREHGAWGGKACGAGGGGSVAVLCPPERRGGLAAAWRAAGARVLDARPTGTGLEAEDGIS